MTFERREYSFLPTAARLEVGDILLGLGHTRAENAPLEVKSIEKNPALVRVLFKDTTGAEYWVTLLPSQQVTLKPPF